ncbi:MAG: hypothetical protein J6R46_07070, partial [Clostridia bacterium]|nr:hypothetical protein [Clostridia bacterium]
LALTMCASLAVIPFIPTTLGLDYLTSPSDGTEIAFKEQNTWIYYVENGKQKREYVRLPSDTQNVFMAWKHLSAVGDEVELLDYRFESDHAQATVVPDTLWEYLQQAFSPASGTMSVTLSPEITSCENYDTLIKSLAETLAKFAGIDPEHVKIMIDGEQSILAGGLKFYHNLQDQLVFAGGQMVITVGMTNVSDYDIEFTGSWTDFAPKAKLRADTIIYVEHLLLPLPNDSTTEIAEYRLAPGESREVTYTFDIPENAELGAYDLIVSFGGQEFTFEKAIKVFSYEDIFIEYTDADSAFRTFMDTHGFATLSDMEFRTSTLLNLSYLGRNMFDIMTPTSPSYPDGIEGRALTSLFFTYEYLHEIGVKETIEFTAKALPDGMVLPYGITAEDSLIAALCKTRYRQEDATKITQEKINTVFTNLDGSPPTLYLTWHDTYCAFEYEYSGNTSMEIRYSADDLRFECFIVKSELPITTIGLSGPITFDHPNDGVTHTAKLLPEDEQQMLEILNLGNWKENTEDDIFVEFHLTVGTKSLHYNATSGTFWNEHFQQVLVLSEG